MRLLEHGRRKPDYPGRGDPKIAVGRGYRPRRLGRLNYRAVAPLFGTFGLQCGCLMVESRTRSTTMDKDRIAGAGHQAKGEMKKDAGKARSDKKLEPQGAAATAPDTPPTTSSRAQATQ